MPRKTEPRDGTRRLLVQQATAQEPETKTIEVEVTSEQYDGGQAHVQPTASDRTPRAKHGVRAGLRDGEVRVTFIAREEQSEILHDWARTTGRTFREVCLSVCDRYIEEVIRPAASGDHKLKRGKNEPPKMYADLYEDAAAPDPWASFFE